MAKTEIILGEVGSAKVDYKANQSYPTNGKFTCGFKPKKLFVSFRVSTANLINCIYDVDTSTTTFVIQYVYNNSYSKDTSKAFIPSGSSSYGLQSIDDDGFTLAYSSGVSEIYYLAVG